MIAAGAVRGLDHKWRRRVGVLVNVVRQERFWPILEYLRQFTGSATKARSQFWCFQ